MHFLDPTGVVLEEQSGRIVIPTTGIFLENICNEVIARTMEEVLRRCKRRSRNHVVSPHEGNATRRLGWLGNSILEVARTLQRKSKLRTRIEHRGLAIERLVADNSAVISSKVGFNGGFEIPTVEIDVASNAERGREPILLQVGEGDVVKVELGADVCDFTVKSAEALDSIGRHLERVPLETVLCCEKMSADAFPGPRDPNAYAYT